MTAKRDVIFPTAEEDAAITSAALSDPDNLPLSEDDLLRGRTAMLAREARAAGLSQEKFAERYGIPVGTLRDWEQGRKAADQAGRNYLKVIARLPAEVARVLAAE
ncbi:MAG TPA: helix-turn-helix domain-containing protein [Azospirillaceae bacterium]|nr:helix-turn-helix domain-containing protein [Azospirillaceae bacterium]